MEVQRGPGHSESGVETILRLKGQKKQRGSKVTRRHKLGERQGIRRRAEGERGAGRACRTEGWRTEERASQGLQGMETVFTSPGTL